MGAELQILFGWRRNHDCELALLGLSRIGEEVHRGFGSRSRFRYLNHEAVGIALKTDLRTRESCPAFSFEDYARHARDGLCHSNSAEQRIAHVERFSLQLAYELSVAQVEVNAVGIGQMSRLILHLVFQVENDGAGVSG